MSNGLDIAAQVATVAAALFAGWQILLSRRQAADDLLWRKQEKAVPYSVFKNPEYRDARDRVSKALGSFAGLQEPVSIRQIDVAKDNDERLSSSLLLIMSHWSRMCTEIELGLIDDEAAYRIHGTTMTNVYFGLAEFIEQRRARNPHAFGSLERVGKRWLERRRADS